MLINASRIHHPRHERTWTTMVMTTMRKPMVMLTTDQQHHCCFLRRPHVGSIINAVLDGE